MSSKQSKDSGNSKQSMRELAKVRRHVDTMIRGRVFTPSSLPPNVVAQPWTKMVAIDVDNVSSKTYTLKNLAEVICAQAGLFVQSGQTETFVPVEFKIFSISCWTEAKHMSMYPQDFLTGNKVELTRADGSAAKNQWARTGYTYPGSFSNITLTSNNPTQMALHYLTVDCQSTARLEVHVSVAWRSANTKMVSLTYAFKNSSRTPRMIPTECVDIEIDVHQHKRQDSDEPESDVASIEDVYSEVRALREELRNLRPT